jgi:hypothetical protein
LLSATQPDNEIRVGRIGCSFGARSSSPRPGSSPAQ